ncbi:MAG: hypothetical protein WEA24_05315 [Gemmatimonadota bacterium]
MAAESEEARTLRAKYWDWCSARLADRFLSLSSDDIYRLARREPETGAGLGGGTPVGRDPGALAGETPASFRELVAQVTESLAREMGLPSFEQWSAAYREDPARFEGQLLGMWRDREAEPTEDEPG